MKAGLAVAHRILTIIWHIIAEGKTYQEVGANYYERQHPDRRARRLIQRLEQLGFDVDARPKVPPSKPEPEAAAAADPVTADPARAKRAQESQPGGLRKRATAQPTDSAGCRKCAAWGIECIHARNAKRRASSPPPTQIQ